MINDQGWVVSRELYSGQSQVTLWSVRNLGEKHIIASTSRL